MPQSSPSGSHQPNVSQPSESAGDNTLRSSNGKILKNCESEQEAISSCPTGFDPIHWEAFAIHENRQEVKDMCAKNVENRSMNLIGHTCGKKPYGRILEELDEANLEKKHRRTDSWKYGHKHRDGTVLERAQEYYMAEEASEHGGEAVYDIACDPLAQVFGKDKGSRTRGLSSCMSNKQLQMFAMAEELVEQESSSKLKLEDELAEVKSTVGNLLASQTRMETMMAGILKHVRLNGSANGQPSTLTTEVDSTSVPVPVPRTQQVPNLINRNGSLNPLSRTSYPNVKILGRKGEHVANGYVKTDGQKCHFRDIMGDEKVVYITNVLVGDAPCMMVPGDDILYLLRYSCFGGFLIWAGGRLQYED
ncbi:hypothetical protein IFM89_010907 [Coptis chinensis]|uniref:Transposase Tnp1/En/Spm-like domain-containing protein n=1 Tax=Coptis chinensis TaxID=261450 RepID=A0A835IP87_9MAGN|nr:hypothetical protein IFM89_010907 [Coptis chinensis]